MLKNLAFRAIAVMLPMVAVLVYMELATLIGLDFRPLLGAPLDFAFDPMNRQDPELLHVRKPNFHWKGTSYGDMDSAAAIPQKYRVSREIECYWDEDGFRNHPPIKLAHVAVVGDSYVEQANLPDEEITTNVLGRLLRASVVNLGQGYYGPQQELVVLKRYALPRKPKAVVWLFFEGNDLEDVLRYERIHPDWPAIIAEHESTWKRSLTRGVMSKALSAGKKAAGPLFPGNCRQGTLADGQPLWFLYDGHPLSPWELHAVDTTKRCLIEAASLCRKAGASFTVAFAPTKYRVYGDLCRFEADSDCLGWSYSDLPARIAEAVHAIPGAQFVDLTPAFKHRAAKCGPLLYWPNDSHWSPAGNALAAAELARAIAPVIKGKE